MNYQQLKNKFEKWSVKKIGVVGPGIVGMPMATLLASAKIRIGSEEPAEVVVIQRNSPTSGWKVKSINNGKSVIGGIEPELDELVKTSVSDGLLSAEYEYDKLWDADVIIVCVQTDKKKFEPDYGPLYEALHNIAAALTRKPEDKIPLLIIESTLAPSSMESVVKKLFAGYGLFEGKNILLGNSPNRVMPGHLVERIKNSDKIVAGLNPVTPELISKLYSNIVTSGKLFKTNSMTAEIEKTIENAYRDVRIAYSAEVASYCDDRNINFYSIRDRVNSMTMQEDSASRDSSSVPKGGMLVPTIGVGGHCLPKDGVLLWWRKIESGCDTSRSTILLARKINDNSPAGAINLAERHFGSLESSSVALLGAAYRLNSDDTRNSPTLALANLLIKKGCDISIHDPFVKAADKNIEKYNLRQYFTNDLNAALSDKQFVIVCVPHSEYIERKEQIFRSSKKLTGIFDGCNIYQHEEFSGLNIKYTGIGKGKEEPEKELVEQVYKGFRNLETGFANEINDIIQFLNNNYSSDDFNTVKYDEVKSIAHTCATGCNITEPSEIKYTETNLSDFSELLKVISKVEETTGNQV